VLKLFGKARFLDADVEDWCLETWAWLMTNLGGMDELERTPLVLPTREFFPPTNSEGEVRAEYIFNLVKSLMGMADWPCALEVHDRPDARQRVGLVAAVNVGASANGTFRVKDGEAIVSYARDLADDPRKLIATLAHELAHYRLLSAGDHLPGGEELHELTTELTVAYSGFGVFGANHAFSFEQHQDAFSQGWSTSRSGYFSERTWAFAIALFANLKGVEVPIDKLKASVADLAKLASRYLAKNDALLVSLRQIA
jgi:hypothetical protein